MEVGGRQEISGRAPTWGGGRQGTDLWKSGRLRLGGGKIGPAIARGGWGGRGSKRGIQYNRFKLE